MLFSQSSIFSLFVQRAKTGGKIRYLWPILSAPLMWHEYLKKDSPLAGRTASEGRCCRSGWGACKSAVSACHWCTLACLDAVTTSVQPLALKFPALLATDSQTNKVWHTRYSIMLFLLNNITLHTNFFWWSNLICTHPSNQLSCKSLRLVGSPSRHSSVGQLAVPVVLQPPQVFIVSMLDFVSVQNMLFSLVIQHSLCCEEDNTFYTQSLVFYRATEPICILCNTHLSPTFPILLQGESKLLFYTLVTSCCLFWITQYITYIKLDVFNFWLVM